MEESFANHSIRRRRKSYPPITYSSLTFIYRTLNSLKTMTTINYLLESVPSRKSQKLVQVVYRLVFYYYYSSYSFVLDCSILHSFAQTTTLSLYTTPGIMTGYLLVYTDFFSGFTRSFDPETLWYYQVREPGNAPVVPGKKLWSYQSF